MAFDKTGLFKQTQNTSGSKRAHNTFLFYIEVLSIDICIGVLGTGALAQAVFKSAMKPAWWVLLPSSVWVVYTVDHLFDALKVGGDSANHRHRFHYKHMKILAFLTSLIGIATVVGAIIYLRELVFLGGFMIAVLALFHVLLAYWGRVRFGKELSVGLIYVSGVTFAPILNRTISIGVFEILFLAGLLLAAYLNLFMNSVIEYSMDRRDGQIFLLTSISRLWLRRTVMWISTIAAVFFSGAGAIMAGNFRPKDEIVACLIIGLYCAVPGAVLRFEKHLAKRGAYRLLAEWVFAAGLLMLFLRPG